jgi:hypothetical protein
MTLNDTNTTANRVPEYEALKHDEQAMALFQSLHDEVGAIKDLIKEKIPSQQHRSFVLTTIWFFATTKPEIARELVAHLQKWDIQQFTYLVYQHIFDALELRKQHLKIEGVWSPNNLGKADIDDLIPKIRMLEKLVNPNKISWSTVPTVPTWLVPTDRIYI